MGHTYLRLSKHFFLYTALFPCIVIQSASI